MRCDPELQVPLIKAGVHALEREALSLGQVSHTMETISSVSLSSMSLYYQVLFPKPQIF